MLRTRLTTPRPSHHIRNPVALQYRNRSAALPYEPLCRLGVLGVGGAGSNVVDTMCSHPLEGVDYYVVNTDAQSLLQTVCKNRIQIGTKITRGTGAGSVPDIGRKAAEESIRDVARQFDKYNMVFVTAGMGGGTGTGAAPVIAKAIKDMGILTVGVVTLPFNFEGAKRMRMAKEGLRELEKSVDTLITISNQNLFGVTHESTGFEEAFKMADNVLKEGIKGIADVIVRPGLINLDFADVRTILDNGGLAYMGNGIGEGENRDEKAVRMALHNPLLGLSNVRGARNVLLSVSGGPDMSLHEVQLISDTVRREVDDEANLILGAAIDEELGGKIKVTLVVSGLPQQEMSTQGSKARPVSAQKPRTEQLKTVEEEKEARFVINKRKSATPLPSQQMAQYEENNEAEENDKKEKKGAFMRWLTDGKWW